MEDVVEATIERWILGQISIGEWCCLREKIVLNTVPNWERASEPSFPALLRTTPVVPNFKTNFRLNYSIIIMPVLIFLIFAHAARPSSILISTGLIINCISFSHVLVFSFHFYSFYSAHLLAALNFRSYTIRTILEFASIPSLKMAARLRRRTGNSRNIQQAGTKAFRELLPLEIWIVIFEAFYDPPEWALFPYIWTDRGKFPGSNRALQAVLNLRLVSKEANEVLLPIGFQNIALSSKHVNHSHQCSVSRDRVICHIHAYSRRILISQDLPWCRVLGFLSHCGQFRELRYVNDAILLCFC